MKLSRLFGILCAGLALAGILAAQPPKPKRLLVIGEVKGFQHDSVSPAMGTMWKLGKETGLSIKVFGPEVHMTHIIPMALEEDEKGVK